MLQNSRWRWVLILSVFAAAILLGLYSYPSPKTSLTDLRSVDELRVRFNQDRGTPRLILLLSPT